MDSAQVKLSYVGIFLLLTVVIIFGIFLLLSSGNNKSKNANRDSDPAIQGSTSVNDPYTATSTGEDVDELKIEITQEGEGEGATAGDLITVNYEGRLLDGTKFDSSFDRGQTFQFELGAGKVIDGWDQGLEGMKVGERRTITIPSELGYGSYGNPPKIPGGSALVFDVEMVEISRN